MKALSQLNSWSASPLLYCKKLWANSRFRQLSSTLIIVISLIFLVRTASAIGQDALTTAFGFNNIVLMLAGCIFYALLLAFLAKGWSASVAGSKIKIGSVESIAVYGISVLPKYFPGSVLQYLSRQVLGKSYGWRSSVLAYASFVEVMLHIICPTLIAFLLFIPAALFFDAPQVGWYGASAAVFCFSASAVLIWSRAKLDQSSIWISLYWQLLFFAGLAILAMVSASVWGVESYLLPQVGGLFLLSWLVGFVIPIAPGGLGVREAAGVALMSGIIGIEQAFTLQISMRAMTLGGDVILFLAGNICRRQNKKAEVS